MLTANSYLNSFFLTSAFFSFYSSFWCTLSNNSSFLWWQRKISSSNAIFNLCKIIFFKKQTSKQKKASIPNCSYLWTFYFLFECLHVHFAITLCKNSYGMRKKNLHCWLHNNILILLLHSKITSNSKKPANWNLTQ